MSTAASVFLHEVIVSLVLTSSTELAIIESHQRPRLHRDQLRFHKINGENLNVFTGAERSRKTL